MRKQLKSESVGSWEITFFKDDHVVIATGYNGGFGHGVKYSNIGMGETKAEAFKQARQSIKQVEEKFSEMPEPYYQYRKNFGRM